MNLVSAANDFGAFQFTKFGSYVFLRRIHVTDRGASRLSARLAIEKLLCLTLAAVHFAVQRRKIPRLCLLLKTNHGGGCNKDKITIDCSNHQYKANNTFVARLRARYFTPRRFTLQFTYIQTHGPTQPPSFCKTKTSRCFTPVSTLSTNPRNTFSRR